MESGIQSLCAAVKTGRELAKAVADKSPDLSDCLERLEQAEQINDFDLILEDIPKALADSREGIAHISRIVTSMKEFSHPGVTSKTVTDINRAIENTLVVSRNFWKNVANVECSLAPDLPHVFCNSGEMNQVFINLIMNAAQAIEMSGKGFPGQISISSRQDDGCIEISVADSGNGVPTAMREKIFDPFFTTKPVGKGTGQGLAICRDVVVVQHGGTLTVGGTEGEGAIFTVRLPIEERNGDAKDNEGL